ncbi:ABC-2 type transport system ATP-binding protein [Natranaerovirga hydrolytica]|uniref:ABC-2 type transport system ATP-binding protein n=1 Tax=Natranaerovirga hydrolytica TaxID=680378 RepID=A0A4R1N7B7_9FIRM|nr:ABC transporter ATP-binding protein [Natranaerovirga hydrolytica]TCK98553.1 ABC-2 type transport system ATP-binding protein [Natranaerovirga hydrolytica]
MNTILNVKNVTKQFKDFTLDDVSFSLDRGYVMGFIGANGAGKTTTIKLIMNLLKSDSGDIEVFGYNNKNNEKLIKDRIGFIYDECYYFDHLSIIDNAKILGPFYSQWNKELFLDYLKRFELKPKQKLKKLSKGMKTKFQIAFALSHNAELLVMDEPTAGLDPVFRREFLDLLYDIMEDEQKSIFFSSHITSDLDRIADYITFISDGKIVFSKSMESIKDSYIIVKGNNELLDSIQKDRLIGLKKSPFGFEALTSNELFNNPFGDSVVIEKPNLEELMFYYKLQKEV